MKKVNPKFITCAGIYRSGSTALFNITRLILNRTYGEDKVYSTWFEEFDILKVKEYNLIKIHNYNKNIHNISDHILTNYRNLMDIGKSVMRIGFMGNCKDFINVIKRQIEGQKQWNLGNHYTMIYDNLVNNIDSVIKDVYEELGIKYDDNDIREIQIGDHQKEIIKELDIKLQAYLKS